MRPVRKRQIVDHVRGAWQVSIRRACRALPVDRSTYHYRSKRTGQAVLMKRIKEIAETRVRDGYRRIQQNTYWFLSVDEARGKCEAWRRDYNEVRPHSAIGNQVPAALHGSAGNPGQPAAR
jgi:transposase InsO family protein